MKKLIQKYQVGGKNWVEKYYYPVLNKGFDFLKEYPAKFLDENIMEPVIGVHPYNFVLNRLQRRTTNTDVPAIIRYIPSYMVYDYINEKTTKQNNQPNQVKKQNQQTKSYKQQQKQNKYTPLIVNKLGGVLFGRKGFKVIDGQLNIIADSGNYLPILQGENGGYKYIGSDGKEHYFNTFTPWDKAQLHKIGYTVDNNKIIKLQNTGNETQSVAPVDTSNPVQPNTSTSFTPEQFLQALLGNDEYIKRFKQLLGIQENQVKPDETQTDIKPESEATKTEVTTPTIDPYQKIIKMNQQAFKNGKGSSRFNRDFRQAFTTALASGDLYNKETGLGSQVFDLGGDWTAEKMLGYITPGKGLTRKGMRRMIKDYNSPSAESINNGINRFFGFNPNASPAQTNLSVINGQEPVVAAINGQVANNVNSFGFDKANYYPNTQNGFNGTSDIDPNAAYRAEQEKRNAINLQNRS